MASAKSTRAAQAHSRNRSAGPPSGYSDATADRIRAYLASVQPRVGVVVSDPIDKQLQRGRDQVERLAQSASDTDAPALRLSASACADVLAFMESVDPIEPRTWWRDPGNAPSHICGYLILLSALERSVRELEPAILAAAQEAVDEVIAVSAAERDEFRRALKRRLQKPLARREAAS
jgi:hypothetical protein